MFRDSASSPEAQPARQETATEEHLDSPQRARQVEAGAKEVAAGSREPLLVADTRTEATAATLETSESSALPILPASQGDSSFTLTDVDSASSWSVSEEHSSTTTAALLPPLPSAPSSAAALDLPRAESNADAASTVAGNAVDSGPDDRAGQQPSAAAPSQQQYPSTLSFVDSANEQ